MNMLFRAMAAAAISGALIAPCAFAQDAVPTPAPAPLSPPPPPAAPATNPTAPATVTSNANPSSAKSSATKKTAAKKTAAPKKKEAKAEPKVEAVTTPEPAVARQANVNVRGQASINSEVITHLKKGDPVTILETITLKKPKQDEPSQWYRIALPANVSVWVNASFVDTNTGTVKARKLNLRGGPGENYSVVGRLEKGAAVKPIDSKGAWLKIEPPTNSFGFVAAHLLEPQPMAIAAVPAARSNEVAAVTPAPAPVTPVPAPIAPAPTVAEVTTPPAPAPGTPVTPTPAPTPAPAPAPAETATTTPATPTPAPAEAATNAPIETVRKVVSREGILKGSVSIQAPTYFELRSLDTGKTINYVYSPSTNLVLKDYKGHRIIVTGEEVLDERWQHTPVLVVDTLQSVP